ncbi:Histone acetyltransferase MCC1 [Glycine soja]
MVNQKVSTQSKICYKPIQPSDLDILEHILLSNYLKHSMKMDMLGYDSAKSDQTLVYVLTLGVVEAYRSLGIASSLIREIIKYASSIPTCGAVYLPVISYNNPAINLYKKMSFKCVRRLHGFYLINGQHYDSFLFLYYVNGGQSPCSPL